MEFTGIDLKKENMVVKRLFIALLLIWAVVTFTFILIHVVPGSPVDYLTDSRLSPRVVSQVKATLGLNKPLYTQYLLWLKNMATGNFGYSFSQHRSVASILKTAIPTTLLLTTFAFLLELILGILLGVLSAVYSTKKLGHLINLTALFIFATPEFWLGLMAIFIFSIKLGWFPAGQKITPGFEYAGTLAYLTDLIHHLVLPVLVLALSSAAYTTRFVRGNMLSVLQKDFILQAKILGISSRRISYKLALKNALLPVITLIGLGFPFLLGGSVVVEYLFSWPGMGWLTFHAVLLRDYPIILATTTITAGMVILGNFLSDLLYPLVDPRIRRRSGDEP